MCGDTLHVGNMQFITRRLLADAYDCLNPLNGHRGRARQVVTPSGGRREMTVSPHLQVKAVVQGSVDLDGLDDAFRSAKQKLEPVRELVRRQSGA